MAVYTHTTFEEAKNRLASLLGDPTKVFYTDSELGVYLQEALRFWGLAAQYWRQTLTLRTVPGQAFYDITSSVRDGNGSFPLAYKATDRTLINSINLALMEPQIFDWSLGWQGTEQFNLSAMADILAHSRDDILRQSACVITEQVHAVTAGLQRVNLTESTQGISTGTIVRGSIQEYNSQILPLFAIDYYQAQATVDTASWPAQGRPKAYTLNHAPLLALDLWPSPLNNGDLRLYSQQVGGELNPSLQETTIPIPTDAALILKYRAMEDILASDGLSRAPEIADYCRQRWQHGLEFLSLYNSVIWADIGGRRMTISSQAQLDSSRPLWQNTSGQPRSVQQLSWNLISLYPVPDGEYDLTFDMVVSAPVPESDGDYMDIGPQYLQAIYDYAQHIAMIKVQGAEFNATMNLYEDTIKVALEHQANIAATAVNYSAAMFQAKADRLMRPVRRPELVAETQAIVGAQ